MIPILKNGTRILRPSEAKLLINGINKSQYRLMFEALLYTGMRYIEAVRFQRHPEWFSLDTRFIHLPEMAQRKKKQIQKERYIQLNKQGAEKVQYFLDLGKKLPTYDVWRENLHRWAVNGGLDPNGITVRTTRKTIECWLTYKYPRQTTKILLSLGHTSTTSLEYYLNMPFTKEDSEEMEEFISGWFY